ncbi:MAG: low molecular weight protein arginine phosphatase [Clostridiales bacterium]|jgi:protein-tyrosine-phosphatase|nr:low molecular weight protein arginine phosphatase [Clostridiales bacterium]
MSEKTPPPKLKPKRILLVCTGNTCRSPMAQAILKHIIKQNGRDKSFSVGSAGLTVRVGTPMMPEARAALRFMHVTPHAHKARPLTEALARSADLIVTMTARQKLFIPGVKTFSIAELTDGRDVRDPYGCGEEVYRETARALYDKMLFLFQTVLLPQN